MKDTTISPSTEWLRSFGRCAAGTSLVYRPSTDEQVWDVFAQAKAQGRRVVLRGGGHSFDGQAVHNGDHGEQIVLSSEDFKNDVIDFDDLTGTVTLGAGVPWGVFVLESIRRAQAAGMPIRLPGTLQTGRCATVGGTLAGDCLSRFSGTVGKESRWIESFRLLTTDGRKLDVNAAEQPDLFNAVIGGQGYIGFVTDATYRLVSIDAASCARTTITRHTSFRDLIQKQVDLVRRHSTDPLPAAISSAWFTDTLADTPPPRAIKGGVFESVYGPPSDPPLMGFPLYTDIESTERYWTEVLARFEVLNLAMHEIIFQVGGLHGGRFENDLNNFLFFMDGNTVAKWKFERIHAPDQFPIVQQTFVVPDDRAEAFAETCIEKMRSKHRVPVTECDMLFVLRDECLMSGNYQLDGFAISLGFEPIAAKGCPPEAIPLLLRELSEDCVKSGGRLHLVKNVHCTRDVFREMYPAIQQFEAIKRRYDPDRLLQNPFSDQFFDFAT